MQLLERLSKIDEQLIGTTPWDDYVEGLMGDYGCEYLDELCKEVPESEILDLIRTGEKLLEELVP